MHFNTVRAVYSDKYMNLSTNNDVQKSQNDKDNSIDFESLVSGSNPNDKNKTSGKSFTLDYLDRYNAFANLSIDDIRTFREILKDGRVKGEELDKLSYAQLKRFDNSFSDITSVKIDDKNHIVVPSGVSFDKKASTMLDLVSFSKNEKFNQSLVNTVKQINKEQIKKIDDFIGELKGNISQMLLGKPILPSFRGGGFFDSSKFDELYQMTGDIDYGQLLDLYLPQLINMVDKSKDTMSNETYEEQKNYINIYENLRNNYNKLA